MTAAPHTLGYDSSGAHVQAHAFAYQRSADQDAATPAHHPIVVVGAGPVGLSLAIDLAQRGQRVLLLDNDGRLSVGSRAICFAKRTLEVWDRLGVGAAMCAKGVQWQVGRVFSGAREVYRFDLLPEPGHARPAFINLQQYYAEAYLAVRAAELPNLEIRWRHAVAAVESGADRVTLGIETPEGGYTVTADHVVACDGSRSSVRRLLGLESQGRTFQDRFLIADVRMQGAEGEAFPSERWFWFDPPFHPGPPTADGTPGPSSVLLHRQPDGVWRIDFQLGWDADPEAERQPERIRPRVAAMLRQALGRELPFTLEWASVYTFACQRMASFRHGRVLFAGDSAHGVSPFGARGANSGVQDAENLAWKLDLVQRGQAPDALLDSYDAERVFAADENILNSTRATDFITPKSAVSRLFRDATLALAAEHPFARRLVNSGRLSVPATLSTSTLNTADVDAFDGALVPGAVAADAPIAGPDGPGWLLRHLGGTGDAGGAGFTLLVFGPVPDWAGTLVDTMAADTPTGSAALQVVAIGTAPGGLHDVEGWATRRYDATPGTAYLIRPDQHVCARWRAPAAAAVRAAWRRATGHTD